ncbi:MAG: Bifunctional homocysteine S-methyltransferase/5,10-methylenetetrahydrofolate reductase [Phycisphaerae bacterium]|nr:Bifunctional homocysteine S-methyltransferase/5,10-methylenetetrahydrofolate reductase [Phycisphaerae bacterium]
MAAKFLDILHEEVLVGDGAMGTELYARGVGLDTNYDELNLTRPQLVQGIHADYITAGARFLETNTYGANRGRLAGYGLDGKINEINVAGVRIARAAAGGRAFVAGSIGSLPSQEFSDQPILWTDEEVYAIFHEQAVLLANAGVDAILLETFSDLDQLVIGVRAAREHTDLPVIASLTLQHRAVTSGGLDIFRAYERLLEVGADVIGTNCGRGVANVLHIIEELCAQTSALVSAFPNAGFPEDVGGRIMYLSSPDYLAAMAERMVAAGANLVGGCCGTTPASIAAIVAKLNQRTPATRMVRRIPRAAAVETPLRPPQRDSYLSQVQNKQLIFVELDPPYGLDFEKMLTGCRVLHNLGVDAITIGDSPLATLRVSNIATAALVQGQIGIECVIHMTCRDHNIIGLQSLLMGAWVQGLKNVLVITGDPAKLGNQPGSSSVYDLNSIGLIKIAAQLNEGINFAGASIQKATGFNIGCGFNPNFKNLDFEVKKLRRKIQAGAMFIMTQLVFDAERLALAVRMIREAGIDAPIFPAVFPFVSGRNAEFVHNELPGVRVPETILQRMARTDKSTGQREGLQIARELIESYLPICQGIYIVPPFNRYEMAAELVEHAQKHIGRPALQRNTPQSSEFS